MKKALTILGIASFFIYMLWVFSYAVANNVWLSSNTATADQLQNLCKGTNYLVGTTTVTEGNHGVFHGACVGTGVAASSVTVYNSSGTSTNVIGIVATSTPTACSYWDVLVSSGLTYTNGSTANISILYNCF